MPSKYKGNLAFKTRGSQHERQIASERVNDTLSALEVIISVNVYKPKIIELLAKGESLTTTEMLTQLKCDSSCLLLALHSLARTGDIKETISPASMRHNAKQKWSLS